MRSFWKILFVVIPALGGYLLYKKSNKQSGAAEKKSQQPSKNDKSSQSSSPSPLKDTIAKQDGMDSDDKIIERLSQIDGVTSRVAENLVKKGISSQEDLTKLSRDQLMEIKGIGPKRAEKILNLE